MVQKIDPLKSRHKNGISHKKKYYILNYLDDTKKDKNVFIFY